MFILLLAAMAVTCLILPLVVRPAGAQPSPSAPSEQDKMVKDVVTLDSQINDINARLAELEGRSAGLQERIQQTDEEIVTRRRRLVAKRKALAARARNIYVNGRSNSVVMLLSSDGLDDFLKRSEYLDKVNRRDTELVATIKSEAGKLESSLSRLKESKAEVDRVASDLESRRQRLAESKAEKQKLLASAGAQAPQVQQQSQRVESKMDQINPAPTGRPTGRFLVMVATGYSPREPGLSDHTATGLKAQRGVVAVDPRVIPLGTRVRVEGYGYAIAADTGSAIKGNRIDLCFDTVEECYAYGRRTVRVEILD